MWRNDHHHEARILRKRAIAGPGMKVEDVADDRADQNEAGKQARRS